MISFRKHISILLFFTSALFIVPKEIIHRLSFHDDTCDNHCTGAGTETVVDNHHHHCAVLQCFISSFHSADEIFYFHETAKIVALNSPAIPAVLFKNIECFSIRGPPEQG